MNQFFVEVGPEIARNCSLFNNKRDFPKHNLVNSFVFSPFCEADAENVICNLNVNKASGIDEITPKLIKKVGNFLVSQLTYIFNLSIETYVFPEAMKIALTIPIYKSGTKESPTNYR